MEASSHGLHQYRLDGVRIAAAAFTNLTRDHLDYHATMEAYLAAKLRLFAELVEVGGAAVICADDPHAERVRRVALGHRLRVITYGVAGDDLRIDGAAPETDGQRLRLTVDGRPVEVVLPLVGDFQAANALAAAGLAMATDGDTDAVFDALARLQPVRGRLEKVARVAEASVYVDYAHTPDALAVVLRALRSQASGRLVVVFGCGGDRDPGKRPEMGRIAAAMADQVIVTDDNPRGEDPASIRRAILAACSDAIEVGDRGEAIAFAVAALRPGDVLLVAGKGHETGQIVGSAVLPFDDAKVVRDAVRALDAMSGTGALWTNDTATRAIGGRAEGQWSARGVSIDSRTVAAGDLFVALQGPNFDGHSFVADALAKGAAAAMVARRPQGLPSGAPLLLVEDTFAALRDLGAARPRAKQGADRRHHRQCRQDRSQGSACPGVVATGGDARQRRQLQQSLGGAAQPRPAAALGHVSPIFEMGMNHAGEITPLTTLVRPHVAAVTTVEAVHLENFASVEDIADAKAEIFAGLEPGGAAVLNRDNPHFDAVGAARCARRASGRIVAFGRSPAAEARLIATDEDDLGSRIEADVMGTRLSFRRRRAGQPLGGQRAVRAGVRGASRRRCRRRGGGAGRPAATEGEGTAYTACGWHPATSS